MQYLIIENGVVTNAIAASAEFAASIGAVANTENAAVGWLYSRGVFSAPPVAPPVVPEFVSMRQMRLAMLEAGLLAAVNDAVAAMTGAAGDAARIEWEFAAEVSREQPLMLSLGLTSKQLDALFIAAANR